MSKFIIDVFNNLLKINNNDVFIIIDINGAIWFGFKDLLKAVGYTSMHKDYKSIDINTKYIKKYKNIRVPPSIRVPSNFQSKTKFINESGLYQLLSKSTKPLAKQFMEKYFTDIMPELRKSGQYVLSEKDKKKLVKLNEKITNLKQENEYLNNDVKYKTSKHGYIYISIAKISIKGEIKKVYKLGISKNIKNRINTYRLGNPNFKLKYYIITPLDKKQLESCVLNINRQNIIKKRNEIIYDKLKNIVDDLKNCTNLIGNKICNCVKCKKELHLDDLSKHKCNEQIKLELFT